MGGVAGGASCAARAARLSETAEIVIFDRGDYVSFANCGLPYYVGDVIRKEDDLLVATPELFRERFNIEVRLQAEVVAIDRNRQTISRQGPAGRAPFTRRPTTPWSSLPGQPPSARTCRGSICPAFSRCAPSPTAGGSGSGSTGSQAKRALIVGGGYIGLEMAENLVRRGLAVTVVEMRPRCMPLLDPEMAMPVQTLLQRQGVRAAS